MIPRKRSGQRAPHRGVAHRGGRCRGHRRRRIAVVTGTRAEYGLLQSTMRAVQRHDDLMLQVVVTGMHLLRKFGRTVDRIVQDGWRVDARVKMQQGNDAPRDQADGLARGISGIARFLETNGTDIVVVLGDRIEAMAGALAGVTTGRLVAHIHGGDVAPGDFDEGLRHAITKLAHVHLAATRRAAQRIIRMGESADRVHVVGAPGLDRLVELTGARKRRTQRSGRALILQHPCGRTPARERSVMDAILAAVEAIGLARTIIYPCSDRGHTGIIEAIEAHRRHCGADTVRVFRSLDRDAYLRALVEADVLVGNSSSGIIEAPVGGTPSVNIGSRQAGRERAGRSVIDADESRSSILMALRRAMRTRPIIGARTVYGDGHAGEHIAEVLAAVPLDESFRRKAPVR